MQELASGNQEIPHILIYSISANTSIPFPHIFVSPDRFRGASHCWGLPTAPLYPPTPPPYIMFLKPIPPQAGRELWVSRGYSKNRNCLACMFLILFSACKLPSTGMLKKQAIWKSITLPVLN